MTNRVRTTALGAALALGVWFAGAAGSYSADDKGGKEGPYNAAILGLVAGKGDAAAIANKAELGDVMQAFKPRAKGGLGVGPAANPVKPDGIEQKFIDLGKRKPLSKPDLAKQKDAIAQAADASRAIADVTLLYADKEGKKNPTKWKQYVEAMRKSSEELAAAARKGDAEAVKKASTNLNASCTDCHGDFRD
jgi:hypothetical protein